MKVSLAFAPSMGSGLLDDAFEIWIEPGLRELDVGVFRLAAGDNDPRNRWLNAAAPPDIQVRHEGGAPPVVTGLVDEGPSQKAGVKVRDRLMAVNGKSTEGLGRNGVNQLLNRSPGCNVTLKLQTGNETPRDVEVELGHYNK
jgi:S1-C subfamily serine protease